MNTIQLVQGDTRPSLLMTLTDRETFGPIDITGGTPRLKFRRKGASVLTDTLVGFVLNGPAGLCKFDWNAATLAGPPGLYEGEVEVTFNDATVQTVYETVLFTMRAQF